MPFKRNNIFFSIASIRSFFTTLAVITTFGEAYSSFASASLIKEPDEVTGKNENSLMISREAESEDLWTNLGEFTTDAKFATTYLSLDWMKGKDSEDSKLESNRHTLFSPEGMRTKALFESMNKPKTNINAVQEFYLCDWVSLVFMEFDEQGIESQDKLDAFEAMLLDEVSQETKHAFVKKGMWSGIEKVRIMLRHPSPEIELGMMQYHDDKEPRVTREGVVASLHELIEEKIYVITTRELGRVAP